MEPTKKQHEFLAVAKAAAKPVAWIGGVRGGKTVGALMALLDAMDERPGGAWAVMAYSWGNLDRNILPVLRDLLDWRGEEVIERRAHPRSMEWASGKVHFFTASDRAAEKSLQGITLQGAMTDEILLFPRNVVMQLVARMSKDRPWWVMTANASDPAHWIKVMWIDGGIVEEFNSDPGDNPHLSQDARTWHDSLLMGVHRDRMLHSEWAGDFNRIGRPVLLDDNPVSQAGDLSFLSIWLDDARHHAAAHGWVARDATVTICRAECHDDIAGVIWRARGESERTLIVCRDTAASAAGRIPRAILVRDDLERWGQMIGRDGGRLRFIAEMRHAWQAFGHWLWRETGEGSMRFRADTTDPVTLAVTQAFCHILPRTVSFEARHDDQHTPDHKIPRPWRH